MSTLREDLELAVKAAQDDGEETPPPEGQVAEGEGEAPPVVEEAPAEGEEPPAAEGEGEEPPKDARPRDEDGKFKKKEKIEAKEDKEPVPAKEAKEGKEPVPAKEAKPQDVGIKAPQSWKPLARENWSKLPAEVQQEVVRREREIQTALNESAEARQTHQKFREAVAPYESMIRAEGGEPLQAVGALLRDAALLRMAPIPVRAQAIARMIQNFLPQEGWPMLDAALMGQAPQPGPGGMPPPQMRDPRVDELMTVIQQQRAAVEQQVAARASAAYEEISKLEFFEDVRQDIADIIEVKARRGVAITPQEAYSLAVRQNPGTAAVVEQREAAKRASQGPTPRRVAASSIRATPRVAPVVKSDDAGDDLRGDLEAAVQQLSR